MATDTAQDLTHTQELASVIEQFQQLLNLDQINSTQDYSPTTVYTPYLVVWLLVYQRLYANATLSQAVGALLEMIPSLSKNRRVTQKTLSANNGAYSRARSRFPEKVMDALSDQVSQTLISNAKNAWEGRQVFMLDGTTSLLSSRSQLRQEFPPSSNQHGSSVWPIVHWAVAHELSSGCALRPELGAMYGPQAVSEITLAQRLLSRIPVNSVVMADANFGVFIFTQSAVQAGHEVVSRLTESRFRSLLKRQPTLISPGCWKVIWKPTPAELRKHPKLSAKDQLTVYLHEVMGTNAEGKELVLWISTTLPSSGASLAALYYQRQDVETDIKSVKVSLQMEKLSSRSPSMIRKEIAVGILAYNLVIQVRRLAAQKAGVKPRKLSFTGTLTLVNTMLLKPDHCSLEEFIEKFEWVLRGCAQRQIPTRPGRKYPRQVLPRGRKHPNRPQKPAIINPK